MTGFQDPARTARSPQREELCWKGSVGGQWLYTLNRRRAQKLIPVKSSNLKGWSVSVLAHLWPAVFWRGVGRFGHRRQIRPH